MYAQKYHKKGMNTIIHPLICYIWFAKLVGFYEPYKSFEHKNTANILN